MKAFDILPANIEDEAHIGFEFFCGGIMCDRFHDTMVNSESLLNQLFSVTGHCAPTNLNSGIIMIHRKKVFSDHFHRIAVIGSVKRFEYITFIITKDRFNGSGAGVNSEIHPVIRFWQFCNTL